jgi:2-amino-4-hydroxy-6-hydroxymethyldihydropteridine diphosphokinase
VKPKTSPELAFISLGSNIDPESYLPLAIRSLHSIGRILKTSKVYQNAPIDRPEQPDFLNAAVLIQTDLQPLEIRLRLRAIEADLDRVRVEDKYAARTIDLDLCLFGDQIYRSPELTLPDPDIEKRPHLAIPLSELDPHFIHPLTHLSLEKIAGRLSKDSDLSYREDVTLLIQKAAETKR